MSRPIWELFPEEASQNGSLPYKILMDLSLSDLLALINGNIEVVKDLYPKMKSILLQDYMDGEDTPESREQAI